MEKLYIGINGHVVCLAKVSGRELWRTRLKSSSVTNVYFDFGHVIAYSGGHLFCLCASDGKVLWENKLSGLGYGTCIIAGDTQTSAMTAQHAAQQSNVAAMIAATTVVTGSE